MKLRYVLGILLACMGSGCIVPPETQPQIVSSASDYAPQPPVVLPPKVITSPVPTLSVPTSWYPPSSVERGWEAIVIHHSGTPNGNSAIFDRWHREGNHWEGVGYDFVIGNGTDSPDGLVEVTFRWERQMTGAHCKTPNNWANRQAVGICLVGNFNDTHPSTAQLDSLSKLIQFLQQRYRISAERVYSHQETPGAIVTECPGRLFDFRSVR